MSKFRINSFYIRQFKILRDFNIDFNENLTVLIGENGSGKSTIIETLSYIYGHLYKYFILKDEKAEFIGSPYKINFDSELENGEVVNIIIENIGYDKFEPKIFINKKRVNKTDSKKYFLTNENILPKIILYYSGITEHLQLLSDHFEKKYIKEISNVKNDNKYTLSPLQLPKDRPFFYIKKNHLEIILLSLLLSNNKSIQNFLKSTIKVDLNSAEANIIIKEPYWSKNKKNHDSILEKWGVTNKLALDFLSLLIKLRDNFNDDINKKDSSIPMIHKIINLKMILLDELKKEIDINTFEIFDFLLFDDLLEKIELTWENENGDKISIDDISEGEKQFLLIKGLSYLKKSNNILFLFDEPDTFLHPKWQAEFINNLNDGLNGRQAIITTHSPNLISDITDSQLYIIEKGKLKTSLLNTYGKSIEKIVAQTFNSPIRNIKTEKLISKISQKIENNEYESEEFKKLFDQLKNTIDNNDTIFLSLLFDIQKIKLKHAQNK